jgi:hypothetical protein
MGFRIGSQERSNRRVFRGTVAGVAAIGSLLVPAACSAGRVGSAEKCTVTRNPIEINSKAPYVLPNGRLMEVDGFSEDGSNGVFGHVDIKVVDLSGANREELFKTTLVGDEYAEERGSIQGNSSLVEFTPDGDWTPEDGAEMVDGSERFRAATSSTVEGPGGNTTKMVTLDDMVVNIDSGLTTVYGEVITTKCN